MLAFGAHRLDVVVTHLEGASRLAPDDGVYAAASVYAKHVLEHGKSSVYVQPEAFAAFIRSGGNQRLYRKTSAALAAAYADHERASLLDIGVGDGAALLPALNERIAHVIAVEPSPMLARTSDALAAAGVPFEAVPLSIQQFIARAPAISFDIAQATFALQSLPPDERRQVWPWLRAHARRVLLVEFDVPSFAEPCSPQRVAHVLARYRLGVAEHASEPLVIQGFLMPVLFGYFDPTTARTNYEQSRAEWQLELQGAGFERVSSQLLDEYWWAPAYLLDASPRPARAARAAAGPLQARARAPRRGGGRSRT
ncbi:MAG TPA: class I SAM-dependent methyltransferase [Polyangiaceae bacterium]|nr:class I SAM-dependent methyltransferase [Polyangiaceae bacterium]